MLFSAFMIGITSSLHCLGMCGPLVMSLHFPKNVPAQKILFGLVYNLGRILSYASMGFVIGGLGGIVSLFGFQQVFSIFIGAMILLWVLFPALGGKMNFFNRVYPTIIYPIQQALSRQMNRKTLDSTFVMGVCNGFLPCGMVSVALAGSLAGGSSIQGMWFMAMFGLGTLPLMFALIYSQSFIPPSFKQKITQYAPVMMAGFAVLLILRGMNIGIPYISPQLMHEGGSLHANCCHKP